MSRGPVLKVPFDRSVYRIICEDDEFRSWLSYTFALVARENGYVAWEMRDQLTGQQLIRGDVVPGDLRPDD